MERKYNFLQSFNISQITVSTIRWKWKENRITAEFGQGGLYSEKVARRGYRDPQLTWKNLLTEQLSVVHLTNQEPHL